MTEPHPYEITRAYLYEISERWVYGDCLPDKTSKNRLRSKFEELFKAEMKKVGFTDIHQRFFSTIIPTLGMNRNSTGEKLIEEFEDFISRCTEAEWDAMPPGSPIAQWMVFFDFFAREIVGFSRSLTSLAHPCSSGQALVSLALHTGIFCDAFHQDVAAIPGFKLGSFKLFYEYEGPPLWHGRNAATIRRIAQYPSNLVFLRESGLLTTKKNLELISKFEEMYAYDSSTVVGYVNWLVEFLQSGKASTEGVTN